MIDAHSHVYFPDYDADREETIRRGFAGGMTRMISVATEPDDWEPALSITAYDERIRAAVGVHPQWFNQAVRNKEYEGRGGVGAVSEQDVMQQLRDYILRNREKVVAIGECGLDYFSRADAPIADEQKAFQQMGFLAQVRLAEELSLPLIIHTRPSVGSMDAYRDMFEILMAIAHEAHQVTKLTAILHCYGGDTELTAQFLTLPNVFFSFTGTITYPVKKVLEGTKDDPRRVVGMIPLERILTETDCPFLAPQSHRGGRNEPSYVSEVVGAVALYQGVSRSQVERQTEANAERIFSLSGGRK